MSTLQTYNLKHPDASGNQITFTSGGDINFDSGAVYIDSAGSVGIGTTSASNQGANFNNLVVGNTSGNNGITVLTGSNNDGIINFNNADDSHLTGYLIYEHSTDSLRFGTAGTGDKMRIGSSGRLLLGGSSSTKNYKLVVRNNAGNDGFEGGIFLQRDTTPPASATGGHGLGTIVFGAAPTGDENEAAQIIAKSDGDWGVNDWPSRLEFYTTPDGSNIMTERIRIDSTGRLLIKDPTAGTYVDFQASTRGEVATTEPKKIVFPNQYSTSTSDEQLKIYLFNSGTTRQGFGTGGNYDLTYHCSGGTNVAKHRFYIDETEKVTVTTNGLTFNGDTAAANALDDYEEGSWTPVDQSGVAITVATAVYTKIGRTVFCDLDLTYNSNSTGGQSRISLPFAMHNVGLYGSGIAGWSSNPDGVKIHVGGNTAYFMKIETGSTIGNAHLSPANLSGYRLIAAFCYIAPH